MRSPLALHITALVSAAFALAAGPAMAAPPVSSGGGCAKAILQELLQRLEPEQTLVAGGYYQLHEEGTGFIRTVKLEEIRETPGAPRSLVFRDLEGTKLQFTLSEARLTSWVRFEGDRSALKTAVLAPAAITAMGARVVSALRHKKQATATRFVPLAKGKSVEISGFSASTEASSRAATALRDIEAYDGQLAASGFQLPKTTRVIVKESSVLPDLQGPIAFQDLIRNAFEGESKAVIMLNPFMWDEGALWAAQVLRHERAHTMFRSTYESSALVNIETGLQEGLADFMAAHFSGDPVIGFPGKKGFQVIRDIADPAHAGASNRLASTIDFSGPPHQRSLLFSHALWKVRGAIGKDAMDGFLKKFLDRLNGSEYQFENLLREAGSMGNPVNRGTVNHDLLLADHFLAVLDRSARGQPFEAEVRREIDAILTRYKLDPARYKTLSARLSENAGDPRILAGGSTLSAVMLFAASPSGQVTAQSAAEAESAH